MKAKIIFSVLGCSYNLCLIGGLVSFILYAYGLDKCKPYQPHHFAEKYQACLAEALHGD